MVHGKQTITEYFKNSICSFLNDGRQTYDNLAIRINGNNINSTNTANFLGFTMDNKLTWEYHIRSCKKRISSGLYDLNTAKQFVSEAHLSTLYFSYYLWYSSMGNNIPKVPTSIHCRKRQSELLLGHFIMFTLLNCLKYWTYWNFMIYVPVFNKITSKCIKYYFCGKRLCA